MESLHCGVVSREGPAGGDRRRRPGGPQPVVSATRPRAGRAAHSWVGGRDGLTGRVRRRWRPAGNAAGRGRDQDQGRKSSRAGVPTAAVRSTFTARSSHCPLRPCHGDVDRAPPAWSGRPRASVRVLASALGKRRLAGTTAPARGTTPRRHRSAHVRPQTIRSDERVAKRQPCVGPFDVIG